MCVCNTDFVYIIYSVCEYIYIYIYIYIYQCFCYDWHLFMQCSSRSHSPTNASPSRCVSRTWVVVILLIPLSYIDPHSAVVRSCVCASECVWERERVCVYIYIYIYNIHIDITLMLTCISTVPVHNRRLPHFISTYTHTHTHTYWHHNTIADMSLNSSRSQSPSTTRSQSSSHSVSAFPFSISLRRIGWLYLFLVQKSSLWIYITYIFT